MVTLRCTAPRGPVTGSGGTTSEGAGADMRVTIGVIRMGTCMMEAGVDPGMGMSPGGMAVVVVTGLIPVPDTGVIPGPSPIQVRILVTFRLYPQLESFPH